MFALLLAAALQFSGDDAALAYATACELVTNCTPRDAGTPGGRRAAEFIRAKAERWGADARLDVFPAPSPAGTDTFANVVAEFPFNPTGRWVVLVSHYDTKRGIDCPGANDGAATSGLLVAFARLFARTRPHAVNAMLIWTDAEECRVRYGPRDGLQGSRRAAERLRARHLDVKAVFCLDMLGDADLGISLPENGSPALEKIILSVARSIGERSLVRRVPYEVRDDHVPFLEAGFHAVDLIDFDYGSRPGLNDYWHTPLDTPDHISAESLRRSGRLVAALLSVLL